jgi:hypothetical protein
VRRTPIRPTHTLFLTPAVSRLTQRTGQRADDGAPARTEAV